MLENRHGLKPGMIITCPRCATRYLLEAGVVRPPGRQVRCARCQHGWFQDAAPDLPQQAAPLPIPVEDPLGPAMPVTDRTRMLPAPSALQPPPRFEIPHPQPMSTMPPPGAVAPSNRQRARSRSMMMMMVGGVVFVGALLLFFSLPNEIARIWPASAGSAAKIGSAKSCRSNRIVHSKIRFPIPFVPGPACGARARLSLCRGCALPYRRGDGWRHRKHRAAPRAGLPAPGRRGIRA